MVVVLFLGDNDEYLGYRPFPDATQAELFIEILQPVMIANIEKTLSLKDRIRLMPEYFPFIGRVQDIELIDLTKEGEAK